MYSSMYSMGRTSTPHHTAVSGVVGSTRAAWRFHETSVGRYAIHIIFTVVNRTRKRIGVYLTSEAYLVAWKTTHLHYRPLPPVLARSRRLILAKRESEGGRQLKVETSGGMKQHENENIGLT